MRARGLLGVAVAVAALALPAGASAQLTWSDPTLVQVLSVEGRNAENPHVAIDANGGAVAVWREFDETTSCRFDGVLGCYRVRAAFRAPGQNFGPADWVSNVGDSVGLTPRVAMDAQGNAIVVYQRIIPPIPHPQNRQEIRAAFRPAGGTFGPPVSLTTPEENASFPQVAMDPQGNAIVSWMRGEHGFTSRIQTVYRPAGGSFGGLQTLSTPGEHASSHRVSFDRFGNAIALFSQTYGAGNPSIVESRVRASYRPAGLAFGPTADLSAAGEDAFVSAPAAFDAAGNALAAWARSDGTNSLAQAAFRPFGLPFAAGKTLSAPGQSASPPHVAFDSLGDALALWRRSDGTNARIQSALRPANNDFAPPLNVSSAGENAAFPKLGTDVLGNAAAIWTTNDGTDDRVEAADRLAGAGSSFSTSNPISLPGDLAGLSGDDSAPQLAMNARGEAIAAWSRLEGANTRVEISFGTPPGVTPPPPPPPPQAGAKNVIQPAEPFKRSRAVVLTAHVEGAVDRLEWSLPGRTSDVVGKVVNGELQRSVRFRPGPGSFEARVTAVGPGGSQTFTRSLTAPKALQGDAEKEVREGLDRAEAAKVFAVGHASQLTGKAFASSAGRARSSQACGPMTVISGQFTLDGCFRPAESVGDIPPAERGVLDALAGALHLNVAKAELMRTAVELTDGYIARGQAVMNDVWPVVPSGNAAIAAFTQAKAIASSNASLTVGGIPVNPKGAGFLLKVNPRSGDIPLGALPRPPSLPTIGGFGLVGDFDVDLERREARITARLKLPEFIKKAGVDLQSEVKLRATVNELIIDEVTVGPINVEVGALGVSDFQIRYIRAGNEWHGQGKACVISGYCLDMVPPNGGVKIKDGRLDFAGASLQFPIPGIPLFSGVNLERIGFGFGLNPTRFTGNARLTFATVLVIDGRMVIAFPSASTPFILSRDEVGNDFPAHLYTYRYTGFTIGVSAGAALRVPAVGEVPFANAYALYEYPGYLALGGGVNFAFPSSSLALISVNGRLDGEINGGNGRFNFDGHIEACVVDVICKGVDGNLSSNGMSVCTKVDTFVHEFHMGGAIRWSPFKFIPYLDGCKWGRFRVPNVRGARSAQAGGPYVVQMKRGGPSRMVMFQGDAGAPRVRVTGPGGQVLESPAGSELVASADANIRIMRSEQGKFAAVGLADAAPGAYTIEPMEGSAAITSVQESTALANARVRARVTGKGKRRTLSYRVGRRPNQSVSFWELDAGGGARQLGAAISGGRGKLRFSPAPGRGTRRIEARFELDGVPAEQRVVARFRPPSPRLGKPRRLRVRRAGKKGLRVSWRGVRGATRYQLAVTLSSGSQRFVTTRRRKVLVRRIPKWHAGRVTVRAVDRVRQGQPARKRFKRAAPKRTNLRSLKRCRVSKRRVVCRRR